MASSLEDLLAQEGFRRRKSGKSKSLNSKSSSASSGHPPLSTSAARRSTDLHVHQSDLPSFSSLASGPASHDPILDEAAVRAVTSILSSYAGRFSRDEGFRSRIRDRCSACLAASKDAAHAVLTNLQLGMNSIERLAGDPPESASDSKIRSLRNSIRLLSIVASLNSPKTKRSGFTCGVPNSHLSAIAQLYLAFVYKIEKNDRLSSKHLLQVFCDAPYLARRNLMPNLWEHFFLPHLLHLKVWFTKEVETVVGRDAEKQRRLKWLSRVYNDYLDSGTLKFALYYKEWLKAGGEAPAVPSVPLPLGTESVELTEKISVPVISSSNNTKLYQAVFGTSFKRDDIRDTLTIDNTILEVEKEGDLKEGDEQNESSVHSGTRVQEQQTSEAVAETHKSPSFRFYPCRNDTARNIVQQINIQRTKSTRSKRATTLKSATSMPLDNLDKAIALLSDSRSLSECEAAVRFIAEAWLELQGDSDLRAALSASPVIEGILDLCFTSKDDETLGLAMSILAELFAMSVVNRQVVLNADPQLQIFLRLLRSDTLCLKTAVVLDLLKPKAKQMLSSDWMPLVLRVLECGNGPQPLFCVQCSPRSAAFYLLEQLLTGFDVDRNIENAKQVIELGGLDLLMKMLEIGKEHEKKMSASLLVKCVRADGSCRDFLAANIKKSSIVELLQGNQLKSDGVALSLLAELISLTRRTQITEFLDELKNEGCLNTMHILLVYLQQAPAEQRPLASALLLQLDLLGDPSRYSIYREEAIDAIIAAIERNLHNKRVQEQCSRALLLLAGRFSNAGMAVAEAWLLKRAGLGDGSEDLFNSKELFLLTDYDRLEKEDKANEIWLSNLATVMLISGNKRLLVALANGMADWIASFGRSCLVTVAWMSCSISTLKGAHKLMSLACSILTPRLLKILDYDRAVEERVLASLTLFNFTRQSGCLSKLTPLEEETISFLQDLAQVTWTARELLFACCR